MHALLLCLSLLCLPLGCQRPGVDLPPPPPPPPPPVVTDTLPPPPVAVNCRPERTPFTSSVEVCDHYPPTDWGAVWHTVRRIAPPLLLLAVVGVLASDDEAEPPDRGEPPEPRCKHHGHGHHHCG